MTQIDILLIKIDQERKGRRSKASSIAHCANSRWGATPTTSPRAAEGSRPTADGGRFGIGQDVIQSARGRRIRFPPAVLPYASGRIFMLHHDMWVSAIGPGAGRRALSAP